MNKLICALLSSAIVLSSATAFCAEDKQQELAEAEPEKTVFSIEEAMEYAVNNSSTVKAVEATVLQYEHEIRQETFRKEKFNDMNRGYIHDPLDSYLESYLLGEGFLLEKAQVSHKIVERSLEQAKFGVKLQVCQQFYTYLNCVEKTKLAKTAVENAQKRRSDAESMLSDGLISELEARQAGLAYKDAQNTLSKCEREQKYNLQSLKNVMAYPSENALFPQGEFRRKAMEKTTVEEAVEQSKTSIEMLNKADEFALQEKLYELYCGWYKTDWLLDSHTAEFMAAKADYEAALRENELNIIQDYNNMVTAYEALEYIDQAIDLNKSGLEAQKASFELGMITSSEYFSACQEYDDLLMQRSDLELDAYLAAMAYRSHFSTEF